MALEAMFGFDNAMGSLMDSVWDQVSARDAPGDEMEGRYFADGLVVPDYARNPLTTGFNIHLAYMNMAAPASEVIIGVDIRPLINPFLPPGVIWGGDFIEAGFGVGIVEATYDRKFIASLDDTTGAIRLYRGRTDTNFDFLTWGGGFTFMGQTAPNTVVAGEDWAHYEFRLNLTTDTVEIRKNGMPIFLNAGMGMGGGMFNRVGYSRNQLSIISAPVLDNFYAVSTVGGARTTYIPNARVCTYLPVVDAVPNAWTPNIAGPHFAMVDDLRVAPPPIQFGIFDQDTTYLESVAAGQREMFRIIPTTTLDTRGLQFYAWFKAMGGVDATVNLVATSPGAVDYVYGPFTILTGYSLYTGSYQGAHSPVLEVDPETGLDWTDARLALWKFGFENIAATTVRSTQICVSKIATPTIPPPVIAGVAPPIGTGGGAGPAYKAACAAPPDQADFCLADRADLLRAINASVVCEMLPPPWREPPEGAERFQRVGSILLPAIELMDFLVLQWQVPTGYDGIITTMGNYFTGAGFVNGSGDLIWRVMIDNQWFKDMDAVDIALGRPSLPYKIRGAGYRIQSHQMLQYFVSLGPGALGRLDPAGNLVCSMFGWLYPRLGGGGRNK